MMPNDKKMCKDILQNIVKKRLAPLSENNTINYTQTQNMCIISAPVLLVIWKMVGMTVISNSCNNFLNSKISFHKSEMCTFSETGLQLIICSINEFLTNYSKITRFTYSLFPFVIVTLH